MSLPTKVQLVDIDANHEGQRIDNYLLTQLKGVPKSRIYRILRKGEVRVNKKRIKPPYRLKAGDQVRIPPVRLADKTNEDLIIPDRIKSALQDVVFEDDSLLVINKPAGVAVHGGSGLAFGVIEALRAMNPDWPFLELAHRLDKDTSGVLILAKQRKVLLAIQEQLRRETKSTLSKSYIAILGGPGLDQPKTVTINLRQTRNSQGMKVMVADREGQQAKSVFLPIETIGAFTLVRIQLHTGRMHQARAHAQAIGRPIVGDELYGIWAVNKAAKKWGISRTQLHSESYGFTHPHEGGVLMLKAPLPIDMIETITRLKLD